MNYQMIIIIFGVVSALFYLAKIRSTMSILIVFVQILSIGLAYTINQTVGYYMFGIAILLSLVYPFTIDREKRKNGKMLWLFLTPVLISYLSEILSLARFDILIFFMMISIVIFVYAIFNRLQFKYEIGVMILFVANLIAKMWAVFF